MLTINITTNRSIICINTNRNIPTWPPGQLLFHIWKVRFQLPRPWRWRSHHMTVNPEYNGFSECQNTDWEGDTFMRNTESNKASATYPAPYCYSVFVDETHVNEFPTTHKTFICRKTQTQGHIFEYRIIQWWLLNLFEWYDVTSHTHYLTAVIWSSTSNVPRRL